MILFVVALAIIVIKFMMYGASAIGATGWPLIGGVLTFLHSAWWLWPIAFSIMAWEFFKNGIVVIAVAVLTGLVAYLVIPL
jgi:hypothetical protein